MHVNSPEIQSYPGLHPRQHGRQGKQSDSVPLLCFHKTPPGVLHAPLGSPSQQGHGPAGLSLEKGHQDH